MRFVGFLEESTDAMCFLKLLRGRVKLGHSDSLASHVSVCIVAQGGIRKNKKLPSKSLSLCNDSFTQTSPIKTEQTVCCLPKPHHCELYLLLRLRQEIGFLLRQSHLVRIRYTPLLHLGKQWQGDGASGSGLGRCCTSLPYESLIKREEAVVSQGTGTEPLTRKLWQVVSYQI